MQRFERDPSSIPEKYNAESFLRLGGDVVCELIAQWHITKAAIAMAAYRTLALCHQHWLDMTLTPRPSAVSTHFVHDDNDANHDSQQGGDGSNTNSNTNSKADKTDASRGDAGSDAKTTSQPKGGKSSNPDVTGGMNAVAIDGAALKGTRWFAPGTTFELLYSSGAKVTTTNNRVYLARLAGSADDTTTSVASAASSTSTRASATQRFAVKIITNKARFHLEVAALATHMNNAAVVSMLRHGKLPAIGAWAIVTEYLPCLGLLRDLQPDGDGQKAMLRLLQRCVQRFCELLEAVESLHSSGWWHMDLKPRNVGIGTSDKGNPTVKLFDFSHSLPGRVPKDWKRAGTAAYAASELRLPLCGLPSAKTDVYGAAATFNHELERLKQRVPAVARLEQWPSVVHFANENDMLDEASATRPNIDAALLSAKTLKKSLQQ